MAVYSAAKRYIWWAIDTLLPLPTTSGITFLRPRRESSTAEWMTGQQDEDVATGDVFVTVDSIPNNPHSEITIVHEFFPSVMQTFLANCCLVTGTAAAYGPLLPPVSMTFGLGNGLDEDQYAGCQLVSAQLAFDNPCLWTMKFIGSEKPVAAAVQSTITLPAWERPFRRSNLKLATLPASAVALSEKYFNALTLDLIVQNTPLYDSRGDGIDGVSAFVLDKQGANMTMSRAYQSATEKAAFLAECGQDGPMNFKLATVCGTGTHTHEFNWARARYTKDSVTAQKNDLMREPLQATGLRPNASDTATGYSILQYKYSAA